MFDVGFSELILLAIVALVVLGPEKLPHAARMTGAWLGRIRRTMTNIQLEIEKEVSASELKERMNKEIERLKTVSNPISDEIKAVEQTIHQGLHDASLTVDAAPVYNVAPANIAETLLPTTTSNEIIAASDASTPTITTPEPVNLIKNPSL